MNRWRRVVMMLVICTGLMLWSLTYAQSHLLGMIDFHFCNNDQQNKELDLVAKAWEPLSLCLAFENKSDTAIDLNLEFLDSAIIPEGEKARACNAPDREKVWFGNFFLPYDWSVRIPPKQRVQKEYTMKYPIGFSGLSHGCVAYYVVGWDVNDGGMFTIRVSSAKYIDVFVSATQAIEAINITQAPSLTKVGDEYIIQVGVENQGNVEEKLQITSVLSNVFGYQKEFVFDIVLPPATGTLLTTPSFVFPIYGGPYTFKTTVTHTPQFNFNIVDGVHPSKIYIWWVEKYRHMFFIWTWQAGVAIVVFILFVRWLIRSFTKKK